MHMCSLCWSGSWISCFAKLPCRSELQNVRCSELCRILRKHRLLSESESGGEIDIGSTMIGLCDTQSNRTGQSASYCGLLRIQGMTPGGMPLTHRKTATCQTSCRIQLLPQSPSPPGNCLRDRTAHTRGRERSPAGPTDPTVDSIRRHSEDLRDAQ